MFPSYSSSSIIVSIISLVTLSDSILNFDKIDLNGVQQGYIFKESISIKIKIVKKLASVYIFCREKGHIIITYIKFKYINCS